MGGFMLYDGDQQLGILSADKLQNLMDSDAIEFPVITEKEIEDRSKGDLLAKGIVILQTSWFIAQCFARLAQHLALTEIELVTMAFAVLNGVLYFFWWNKPVDIRCSVPVFLKTSRNPDKGSSEKTSDPIESVPIPAITSDTGVSTPWTATGNICSVLQDPTSYEAQVSLLHDNPEPCTTSSVPPGNINGVQATAPTVSRSPSLRDDVHIHAIPLIPRENIRGIQVTEAHTVSRSPNLRDDIHSHITPVIPLENIRGIEATEAPTVSLNPSLLGDIGIHITPAIPLEKICGVQVTAPTVSLSPTLRNGIDIHATSVIPLEKRSIQATVPTVSRSPSLCDDVHICTIPIIPLENTSGVQPTVFTVSRRPSLRDDVCIHITPGIPSNQNSTHILPKDPSGGLSRQASKASTAFTYRPGQENSWLWRTIIFLHLTPFAAMAGISMSGSTSIPNHSERVHTFYARSLDPSTKELLSVGGGSIAAIFGAIHCIAWNFSFPTHVEQTIWRVSALLAAIAPNAFTLFPMLADIESATMQEGYDDFNVLRTLVMVCFLGTFVYFPARLYLLVEACISLRSLPPSALENVKWTSFIPHL